MTAGSRDSPRKRPCMCPAVIEVTAAAAVVVVVYVVVVAV